MIWKLRALWLVVAYDLSDTDTWMTSRKACLEFFVLFKMARGFENFCEIISD